MKRVLVIDGMNNFVRSYVVDPTLDVNGNPIGGLSGFLKILQKNIREIRPDKIVVCWEGPSGSQKRRSINKNYKAGRKPPRLKVLRVLLKVLHMRCHELHYIIIVNPKSS